MNGIRKQDRESVVAERSHRRPVRKSQTEADVPSVLDSWSTQAGYKLRESGQTSRTYKRGAGFWVAARMLKLSWSGNDCTLEAWIKPPIGKDIPIESGGITGVAPRMVAHARQRPAADVRPAADTVGARRPSCVSMRAHDECRKTLPGGAHHAMHNERRT